MDDLYPAVKLEPLQLEPFEEVAEADTEAPAEGDIAEPEEEPEEESEEEAVDKGASQRRALTGLLDMIGPARQPTETKKRPSAVVMDTRNWKRYRPDLAVSPETAILIPDDDEEPEFHSADSVWASPYANQQTGEGVPHNPYDTSLDTSNDKSAEQDFHGAAASNYNEPHDDPTETSLDNPVEEDAMNPDFPELPQATSIESEAESNLHQAHTSSSHTFYSNTPGGSAMSAMAVLANAALNAVDAGNVAARRSSSAAGHRSSSAAAPRSSSAQMGFNASNMMHNPLNPVNVLDHRGYPMSEAAVAVACQYWDTLRQFERCPFGSSGVMPSVDLLVRIAQHRQKYTELVLGLGQAMPGTQTFEPPFIAPNSGLSSAVSTSTRYDRFGSMDVDQVTTTSPYNNLSQAPVISSSASTSTSSRYDVFSSMDAGRVEGTNPFRSQSQRPVHGAPSTSNRYDGFSGMDANRAGTNPYNNPSQAPAHDTSSFTSFQGDTFYDVDGNSSHFDTPNNGLSPAPVTGTSPHQNPSQRPVQGNASVSFQDDTFFDDDGDSSHFDHLNNGDSPGHRSSPNAHVENSRTQNGNTQNGAIRPNQQTNIPSPHTTSNTPDVLAKADAEVAPMVAVNPALNDEQQRVVDLAAEGHNIFYTGSAGSGKSTVLHAIKRRLEEMGKTVRVMAPTGKVALAINGTTTWTFAGWTPDSYKRGIDYLKKVATGKTIRKRFRDTDVIIIDEISMVDNLHLERLNQVMKAGRTGKNNSGDLPFGGVQVIATGDFFQLPPITPFQICLCGNTFTKRAVNNDTIHMCSKCYTSFHESEKWAFKSRAWEDCGFVHAQLSTIHRQRDPEFIAMLQKCRKGVKFTPREVDVLMNHPSVTHNAVKLFSTREEVRRTNDAAFRALDEAPHGYRCFDKFEGSAKHPHLAYKGKLDANGTLSALADHRFDQTVELKRGMPVVLLVNDLTTGLANGSQGIIIGFEPYAAANLPQHVGHGDRTIGGQPASYPGIKNAHIRMHAQLQRPGLAWPIVKFFCGIIRTIYPICHVVEIGDEAPYSLLCRTQVPLTAGYAMSIHRSQGLTLDRVIVDLSRQFEHGMVYVALSRATGLQGLKIEGDQKGLIVGSGNKEVRSFMKEKFDM